MDERKIGGTATADGRGPEISPIDAKLKALLADRRIVPAGRLQFVNLGPIRERFGAQWPTIADRANAMATTIINRALTRGDVLIPIDELAYLLLFGTLSEDEAQIKCGFIASEISRHLLGEDSGLQYAEIQTVVVSAELPAAGPSVRLDDIVAQFSGLTADSLVEQIADPDPVPPSAPTGDGGMMSFDGLGFSYRPMWDVKRNALSTFLCVPQMDRGSMLSPRVGYEIAGGTENPQFIAALDLACLDRVRFDLENLERQKRKLLIGCPVHYETLRASRRRLQYLERCGRLKESLRAFLIFEVCGIPEDVPQIRILELVAPLNSYSRARTIRVPINRVRFDALQGMQVHAVGVDLSETSRGESEIFSLYNRFVDAAGKAKLRTFVHGLRSLSLASAAVCAGFDYVDGDAVKSAASVPDNVYRFRSVDLFRALRP